MTDKQEYLLMYEIERIIERLNKNDVYVSRDYYELIKQKQELMNMKLNSLIQCDE